MNFKKNEQPYLEQCNFCRPIRDAAKSQFL